MMKWVPATLWDLVVKIQIHSSTNVFQIQELTLLNSIIIWWKPPGNILPYSLKGFCLFPFRRNLLTSFISFSCYHTYETLRLKVFFNRKQLSFSGIKMIFIAVLDKISDVSTLPHILFLYQTFCIKKNHGVSHTKLWVIWNLSECNGTQTHNHFVCKWSINHSANLSKIGS